MQHAWRLFDVSSVNDPGRRSTELKEAQAAARTKLDETWSTLCEGRSGPMPVRWRRFEVGLSTSRLAAAMEAIGQQVASALGPVDGVGSPKRDYTRTFAAYTRNGDRIDVLKAANAIGDRPTVHAAMSIGSNTNWVYLASIGWDRKLHDRQRATSPMRRLASVQVTSVSLHFALVGRRLGLGLGRPQGGPSRSRETY